MVRMVRRACMQANNIKFDLLFCGHKNTYINIERKLSFIEFDSNFRSADAQTPCKEPAEHATLNKGKHAHVLRVFLPLIKY